MTGFDSNPQAEQTLLLYLQDIQQKWPGMTPQQREQALENTVSAVASAAGLPNLELNGTNTQLGHGVFDFTTATIEVSQDLFNKPTLSKEEAGSLLANTIAHELRHAEQWSSIVQLLHTQGNTAQQIEQQTGIKRDFIDHAIGEVKKNPLSATEQARAQTFYDSVYGTGGAHRQQVLTDLPQHLAAYQQAINAYQQALQQNQQNPGSVSPAQLQQLQQAMQQAKQTFDTTYQQYRNLPEEKDAWDFGDNFEKDFRLSVGLQASVSNSAERALAAALQLPPNSFGLASNLIEDAPGPAHDAVPVPTQITPSEFQDLKQALDNSQETPISSAQLVRFVIDQLDDADMAYKFALVSPEALADPESQKSTAIQILEDSMNVQPIEMEADDKSIAPQFEHA